MIYYFAHDYDDAYGEDKYWLSDPIGMEITNPNDLDFSDYFDRPTSILTITSIPTGSTAIVNGVSKTVGAEGATFSIYINTNASITISKFGYTSQSQTLYMNEDKTVNFNLIPAPIAATVSKSIINACGGFGSNITKLSTPSLNSLQHYFFCEGGTPVPVVYTFSQSLVRSIDAYCGKIYRTWSFTNPYSYAVDCLVEAIGMDDDIKINSINYTGTISGLSCFCSASWSGSKSFIAEANETIVLQLLNNCPSYVKCDSGTITFGLSSIPDYTNGTTANIEIPESLRGGLLTGTVNAVYNNTDSTIYVGNSDSTNNWTSGGIGGGNASILISPAQTITATPVALSLIVKRYFGFFRVGLTGTNTSFMITLSNLRITKNGTVFSFFMPSQCQAISGYQNSSTVTGNGLWSVSTT